MKRSALLLCALAIGSPGAPAHAWGDPPPLGDPPPGESALSEAEAAELDRKILVPPRDWSVSSTLDAPSGTGMSGVDSDGRPYVSVLKLAGRRSLPGERQAEYIQTYRDIPVGAVFPVNRRLWQVFAAGRHGVQIVRPGAQWTGGVSYPDGNGKTLLLREPYPEGLPSPPKGKFLVAHRGSAYLPELRGTHRSGGSLKLTRLTKNPQEGVQEDSPPPVATLVITTPSGGNTVTSREETVREGDRFVFTEEPPVTLTVTRIVPSAFLLVGWVEFTDERVAAGGTGEGPTAP